MPKVNNELNILITPEQTIIGGEVIHPTTISIVLENGHSYELQQILKLLEKHDKKTAPRKPFFSRTKRFFSAVKQVLKEEAEHDQNQPKST
jgi:hypothetical protein